MIDTIELAHEPGFQLGRVTVLPAQRELVRDDGQREVLEHRVMQVLIALSRANGAILTREELLARCWSGRVVGEDAINRVMSRLRKAAEGIGAGSFAIETITKVGYRLVAQGGAGHEAPAVPKAATGPVFSRRAALAGAAAVGVAGVAGLAVAIRGRRGGAETPENEALMAQAWAAWTQGSAEGNSQAIGLYRRLLDANPRSADGWGLLGCAYADRAQGWVRPSERESVRLRASSAGRRSLELDSRNACGRVAIAWARPIRGNWLLMEREFRRAMADQPGKTLGPFGVARLLLLVGRFSEAAPLFERVRDVAPTVNQYRHQIDALWGAGRQDEAERLLDEAMSIYAANQSIWFTRFKLLLFGGRASAAVAMLRDAESRPRGMPQENVDDLMRLAVAVETRAPPAVAALVAYETRRGRSSPTPARYAIENLSAVGRVDEAFALADAYFFSRGFVIPDVPAGPGEQARAVLEEREPSLLFLPATRAMRADPRFSRLTEELGLERYWREAKAQPDYRRLEG
ncbi:winged helix-turn-helix domain-containing protein [Phenylobacterium sp.]|uniref:winged helix-turn-helix domain-containing protein n=1 Tax=Phenylobacterium sp. TaxID=1871053 RepID=UPI0025FE1C3F|nr:winged helix-turn-helix domain-containing protein [Phenylobacterium sp.]